MNKIGKEDFYKLGIVLGIFAIICIILFISMAHKKESLNEHNNQFEIVSNYNIFFFVTNNVNNYVNYTINRNTEALFSFLEEGYRTEKNITRGTVLNILPVYKEGDFYKARLTKSYTLNDSFEIYYTEGQILNEGYAETTIVSDFVSYLLYVDFKNMTTSIVLLDSPLDEEKIINETDRNKEISLNSYNKVEQVEIIDYTRICSMYISDFIEKAYNNLNEAYSKVVNFDSMQEFNTFIEKNNITSDIQSCVQNINDDGKRVYQITDRNNYKYTFIEDSILNYKVSLTK